MIFSRKFWARAKNNSERIESLRFSVPALRVGVLEYGAGQLQTNNAALDGKPVRLYYPPEAVSDEKFLKSLETAPVIVGGHDATTNEQNKKIDGWPHSVSFDAAQNAAMISGVVKGAKEVAYIKNNLGTSGFGASAFVDIFNLKVEDGTTPDGQTYNAIALDLRATHVALAPNVRDPENKIKVANAVVLNSHGEIVEGVAENMTPSEKDWYEKTLRKINALYSSDDRRGLLKWLSDWENTPTSSPSKMSGAKAIDARLKDVSNAKNSNSEEFMDAKEIAAIVKNAVDEALTAKNEGDRMDALENTVAEHGKVLNEINEKLNPKDEKEGESKNADAFEGKETPEEEKKEAATLENAKPAQTVVAAFASAFNVDFGATTPSFSTLAALAGIKESDAAARIAAVNAKYAELGATAKNTAGASTGVSEVF